MRAVAPKERKQSQAYLYVSINHQYRGIKRPIKQRTSETGLLLVTDSVVVFATIGSTGESSGPACYNHVSCISRVQCRV